MNKNILPLEEWLAIGKEKFKTDDVKQFKFECPNCKQTQTAQEFIDAKIENASERFFFSCIGRWVENRGCNWTLGGLLQIHKTEVINQNGGTTPVFEFADETLKP